MSPRTIKRVAGTETIMSRGKEVVPPRKQIGKNKYNRNNNNNNDNNNYEEY